MFFDVIIQARMNSKRLPGKVLLKVNNKTMLEYLIERVKKIKSTKNIIVATTLNKNDNKITNLCNKLSIKYFRGNEKNVLNRIYLAAKKYKSKNIIFITADCPIIDYKIINRMIIVFKKKKYDYIGNSFVRSYPDGMDAQIFSFKTLERASKIAKTPLEKEHVTLSIKKNFTKFKIKDVIANKKLFWPDLGLTLDQIEDFQLIKNLLVYFRNKNYFFGCQEVINLLRKKKKKLAKIE